ncbi:hypothetical protein N657DRAFT_613304 [Parathielavia appendiculata]|uniref:Uncharacterized protein n=1 Tax=Parathielavia appendiculata TaxID=2587402 RepID=A0AAN6U3S0_9PEZI|nr:hypothetical protein N657DRAFT_613304 [Parathielavia appendiculata]
MATESPKERSDEATLTSATELNISIDTDSKYVDSNRPHINGDASASATDEFENKHITDIVDDLVNSTEVSISGGSDNEAAKSDASKTKDDAKSRASSGLKKPASFKPINVNKTFLTAKASAPGAQSKPPEKAGPTTTGAPAASTGAATSTRPRLVAKAGSGLVAKGSGANGGKSAPDGNAVWNKNRPAPPPEPKKYTDEELKKYGIHMATRLQTDDPKASQSNWADIDDDDEDWVPDTITWKDGTKIAIAPAEEHPAPAPEPAAPPTAKENEPAEKAKPPAPGPSPAVKPGVLASGKGLVLKGAPEKPTLVAKPPPPPAPTKSPWAPLPKIDKVSPVAVDAPTQAGPIFPSKNAPTQQQTYAAPPPKEIAADDFSRGAAWRDGAPGANRELFNSQSGRYEPVFDRRGPMRHEPSAHGRQPALLQRGLPHEQQGPIEPPGASQAGRNNEQQGSYGRRRGSSNVSGGSGSWQRLKSLEHPLPPPELINARRASQTGGSDSPASPRNFSPSGVQGGPRQGQPWQPRPSPGTIHATPFQTGGPAPDGRSMPPPAQPPSSVAVTEDEFELQKRLMRERRELAMRRRQEEEAREEAARRERIRLKLEALGPPPESNSAKKAAAKEQPATPTQIQSREKGTSEKSTPAESHVAKRDVPAAAVMSEPAKPTPPSNGPPAQPLPQLDGVEPRSQQPSGSSHSHSWAPAARPPDRQSAGWGLQPSKNVWAAPISNRSLGNGTFAADIGAPQLPTGPGPIAPPSSARAGPPAWQPPIGPPRQPSRGSAERDREMKDTAWAAAVRLNDDKFAEMLNTEYEDRQRRMQAEGRSLTDIQPAIRETWRPVKLDDNGVRTEAATKQTLQIGQENPWAAAVESKSVPPQQTPSVSSGATSEYSQLPQGAVPTRDLASASMLGAKTATAQQGRGSRFFPSRDARQEAGRDVRTEASSEVLRYTSPSPPPPDMDGHPAFDGDATHPHVSLPRPHPVVRLPPSVGKETQADAGKAPPGQSRSQGPSFAWAAQAAYREPDNGPRAAAQKTDSTWQAKIDSLLGGRKVHPSRAAGPDSRVSHHNHEAPSPVPQTVHPRTDESVTSKVMDEECFEEQEMGSTPPIRLPKTIPEMAWQPSPPPKPLHKKLYPVVVSRDPISFPVDVSGAGTVWRVRIPGTESKSITIPFGRTRSNPRRGGGPRGGRHASSTQHRPGKGREASSSYSAEQGGSNASGSGSSHGRNSRGGYRGRNDNWSRNATAQIQT